MGWTFCRAVRGAGLRTPILLLTARSDTTKIVGLKLGADDYLTKPFDMLELTARVGALLRRSQFRSAKNAYVLGSISIDVSAMEVTKIRSSNSSSAREFQLLCYFAEHPGAPLSRAEMLREAWGYDVVTLTRTVDVHVAGLRQKLEEDPKRPQLIVTLPGIGYRLSINYGDTEIHCC
jgi:two-component system alkaline phosphatase synthesis response regulator PhoP